MYSKLYDEILSYFPENILEKLKNVTTDVWDKAKEIRIRAAQPVIVETFDGEIVINYIISLEDIIRLIENFSCNSVYSIQNEINNGYITIKGGHRIGISGTSVFENNLLKNIKYISSLNIRIAREVKNCSLRIFDKVIKEEFENTIIISPPRVWKNNDIARHD